MKRIKKKVNKHLQQICSRPDWSALTHQLLYEETLSKVAVCVHRCGLFYNLNRTLHAKTSSAKYLATVFSLSPVSLGWKTEVRSIFLVF